jgi:O-antigen ligase
LTRSEATPLLQASGLGALLLVSTLGEGGAQPTVQLAEHGLAAVIAITSMMSPSEWRPARSVVLSFSVFLAFACASAAIAPYGYAAFLTCWELVAFTAVAWAGARCGDRLPQTLAPWLAAGIAAHGLAALVQRFLGETRPATTFFNTNHLAAWLVAASFVVGGALPEWTSRARAAGIGAIAVGVAAFAASGSRGAVLAVAASGAVWLAAAAPSLDRRRLRIAIVVLATAVTAGAAGAAWRFATSQDPFAFQRLDIWRASTGAIAEDSLLGTGPGQFHLAANHLNFPLERQTLRYARSFPTPHSDVLRAACEFGIPAAAALGVTLGLVVMGAVRRRREGLLRGASLAAAAALAGLVAQGAVDDLTGRPALYLLAAALVGSLVAVRCERSAPLETRSTRVAAGAAAILAFLILDVAPWRAWRAEQDLPSAPPGARLAIVDRALVLNPYVASLRMRRAEVIAGEPDSWSIERYAFARESAEQAMRLSPADATLVKGAARIDALACRTFFPVVAFRRQVARRFELVEALAPHDAFATMEAATTLLELGDPAGAAAAAARAEAIEPRAAAPRLLRAEALAAQGNAAAARKELDAARALAAAGAPESGASAYHAGLLRLPAGRAEALEQRLGSMAAPAQTP